MRALRTLLTQIGAAYTDRFVSHGARKAKVARAFARRCAAFGAGRRLVPPRRPPTKGLTEHVDACIGEVLRAHRFIGGKGLGRAVQCFVALFSQLLPKSALGGGTSTKVMTQEFKDQIKVFDKKPITYPVCGGSRTKW